jgi:hypothetical protein
LPLAGSSPLAELFQLCLTSATPIDVMGLKQRSAPNKHKLKGGTDLVPPLFFGGQPAPLAKETLPHGTIGGRAKVV